MAAESNLEVQETAQSYEDFSLMNDDEAIDDNSDEDKVDDFLDKSDEFELQEMNIDSLQSGLVEEITLSTMPDNTGVTDIGNSKTLLFTGQEVKNSEDEDDIDSDEENIIMKEIRGDIESKVCEEMKSELKDYQECMQAFETSDEPLKIYHGHIETLNQEDRDPRLQEAMLKMKKLDKILLKKIRIEKEVKRNRILLEKRMRLEIAEMTKGVNVQQDIMINTEKFLALEPPASHNEGVTLDDDDDGRDLPPLFQTQISESELFLGQDNRSSCSAIGETGTNRTESMFKKSSRSNRSQSKTETKGKKQKTDFIKRNKELAANADQSVAMTDDEKQRLAELLEGVDELSDPEEAVKDDSVNQISSYQLALHPGEGFCPDTTEMKSLASIDEKLKALMPEDVYQSFVHPSNTPSSPVVQLFSRVGVQTQAVDADLPDRYGERVLCQTKDDRELKARLQSIEQELDKFNAPNEDESCEECHLTDEQLDSLLDQCARYITISDRAGSPDLSARSIASSRLSMLENPPKLSDEQLQKLLSEAHFPLSSRLLSVKEDKIFEDKNSSEAIRAETWKAIKDFDLDEAVSVGSPFQININQNPESRLDLSDDVNLNVSNNHNTDISTNNIESNNQSQGNGRELGESVTATTPPRYSAGDLIQTSIYPGAVVNSLHGFSGSLPRISQSNGVSRSESYLDNFTPSGTSILLPRESTEDAVRLTFPNISTKSFLVHAQQGMNNALVKDRMSLPTRQPLEIVCNDFSDVKGDSASGDKEGARGQGYGCKPSGRVVTGIHPRPFNDKQLKDHQG